MAELAIKESLAKQKREEEEKKLKIEKAALN